MFEGIDKVGPAIAAIKFRTEHPKLYNMILMTAWITGGLRVARLVHEADRLRWIVPQPGEIFEP